MVLMIAGYNPRKKFHAHVQNQRSEVPIIVVNRCNRRLIEIHIIGKGSSDHNAVLLLIGDPDDAYAKHYNSIKKSTGTNYAED